MHQNTPAQPAAKPVQSSPHQESTNGANQARIGKSLIIKGEITGSESVYVDGKVEGSINLPENRVTVGPDGQVFATITALEVLVQGKITGNVNVTGRLEVRSEGSLIGDVIAERINVADGAFFKGKIEIRRPGQRTEGPNGSWDKKDRELSSVGADSPYQKV